MLKSNFVREEKIYIGSIPLLRLKNICSYNLIKKNIIFYHGWSSNKESQRARGLFLSSLGYTVYLPEAINHGERGQIDFTDVKNGIKYFWPTILNTVEEARGIISYLREVDKIEGELYIGGNSMGGFISSGIFANNENIDGLFVLNGSCNWDKTNRIFVKYIDNRTGTKIDMARDFPEIYSKIDKMDPMSKIDKVKGRRILLLHGDSDTLVPIEPQREFFNKIKENAKDSPIEMIEYKNLNHFVTTNMLEEIANFIGPCIK